MNKLSPERQAQVIAALVEGNSIRATVRMTGVAKNTIVKLLVDVGKACAEYQDKTLRNLPCKKIQCDEIWAFCYAKEKNVPIDKMGRFGYGDVWTWTALATDTKLIVSWLVADRSGTTAMEFLCDLSERLSNKVQLTTDGNKMYLNAVDDAFGGEIDYTMLVKMYGNDPEGEKRYSPAKCIGAEKAVICGKPDKDHTSTSYVERQNLTMRMSIRRFTRLTNAFSKKVENLAHAVALHFMYYNFCRTHQTLRITPAMAAGMTDHAWDIKEIVAMT